MICKNNGKIEKTIGPNGITIKKNGKVVKHIGPGGIFDAEHDGVFDEALTESLSELSEMATASILGNLSVIGNNIHVSQSTGQVKVNGRNLIVHSDNGCVIENSRITVGDRIIDLQSLPHGESVDISYHNGQLTINGQLMNGPQDNMKKRKKRGKKKAKNEIAEEISFENWISEKWTQFKKWWREN